MLRTVLSQEGRARAPGALLRGPPAEHPPRGADEVGELLDPEEGGEADVGGGEGERLEGDQGGRRKREQADEGSRGGCGSGHEEGGEDVAHLLAVGVADDPPVGPGVHEGGDNVRHEVARDHGAHVAQDERAEEDGGDAVAFLDHLELEKEVAAADAVERLEVGGVDGQQRVDEAVDLHEPHRVAPLIAEQHRHEGGRYGGEEDHGGGDEVGGRLQRAPHQALHLGRIVLRARDRREHHRLYGTVQEAADGLRVPLALGHVPEARRGELAPDDQVGEALVALVQKPGDEEAGPETEEPPRARRGELQMGPPVELGRVRQAVGNLVGELLGDEGPHAGARHGAPDAARGGNGRGEDGGVEDLPHLQPAGDEGDLHRVVGVDHEQEREGPERPDEPGQGVEGRDGRRREEDRRVEDGGYREAHPEHGRAVDASHLRRLYERRVHSGLHHDVAEVHEDEHDGEHAELLGGEQACHDNLDGELDDGVPPALKHFPQQRRNDDVPRANRAARRILIVIPNIHAVHPML